jgi:hypothetical protein
MPKVKGAKASRLQEKAAARTYLAPPDAKQQLSNEERLLVIAHRAVYLYGVECKPYRKIAIQIQAEFQLVHTPSVTTVCRWMNIGRAEFLEDIRTMRDQLRLQQFNEVEDIKRRWIEAAMRNLDVRKRRMRNGQMVEEVDEDDFQAHCKAAEIVLKCCERQAKLVGLDLAANDEGKEKHQSPQEIYLFIQDMIQKNGLQTVGEKVINGQTVQTFGELELCLDSPKPREGGASPSR